MKTAKMRSVTGVRQAVWCRVVVDSWEVQGTEERYRSEDKSTKVDRRPQIFIVNKVSDNRDIAEHEKPVNRK